MRLYDIISGTIKQTKCDTPAIIFARTIQLMTQAAGDLLTNIDETKNYNENKDSILEILLIIGSTGPAKELKEEWKECMKREYGDSEAEWD